MKILALESSAVAASAALCEEDTLLAQTFLQTGLTHSQTLLPMVEELLRSCHVALREVELIGVAVGPGSFTGLRIGVSAAKGLAWADDIPCAACSTLEAMAWNAVAIQGELCAVMDARRGQVYHARFYSDGQSLRRLCPDRAISIAELSEELEQEKHLQFLIGDGAGLCYPALQNRGLPVRLAPANLRSQSAWGVARCALALARRGELVSGGALEPVYLRLSQAERERRSREEKG